jgi:dipeptidyl aminopeptidase/acylaminoacyl peptidase
VVFHSGRAGNLDIYRMNPDGSGVERLTANPAEDSWPDISPNGRYVAFASTRTGNREIFVLDLSDGTLLNVSQSTGDDNWPRWSPNGHDIAFHSNRDGNYEIYVVNADGTGLRRVTNNSLLDQWPDWSPNGKEIAFRRGVDVYAIDANGEESNPRRLTNLPTLDQMPAWSPNGHSNATGSRSSVTRSSLPFGMAKRSRKYRPRRVSSAGCSALMRTCQRQRFLMRSTGHGAGPMMVMPGMGRLRRSACSHVVAVVATLAVAASVVPLNTTLASRTFGGYVGVTRPASSSRTNPA